VRIAKKRKPFYVAKERHAHVPVYECYQKKSGKTYKYFSIADVSGDRRKGRAFSDADEAITFADDTTVALAREPEILAFTAVKRPIQNALEALEGTGLRIDRACQIIAEALKVSAQRLSLSQTCSPICTVVGLKIKRSLPPGQASFSYPVLTSSRDYAKVLVLVGHRNTAG
jgi:hypothetical protein